MALSYNQSGLRTQKEMRPYADISLPISHPQILPQVCSWTWASGDGCCGLWLLITMAACLKSPCSRSWGHGRIKEAWQEDWRRSRRISKLNFITACGFYEQWEQGGPILWVAKWSVVVVMWGSSALCRLEKIALYMYFDYSTVKIKYFNLH